MTDMYCGAGDVPRGKKRGTVEYCIQTNQVRYYGIKKIDRDLLKTAKGVRSNLIAEQLKLKKIEDDAKILIRDIKKVKIVMEADNATKAQLKAAKKKYDSLLNKRDALIVRLKRQQKRVHEIEAQEKANKKERRRK